MNDSETHINWEVLAHRYLSGESTEAEQEQLLSWVQERAENKDQYLHFKRVFDEIQSNKKEQLFDAESAYESFITETQETAMLSPETITFDFYVKVGVAAAVVGILLSVLYFMRPSTYDSTIVASADSVRQIMLADSSSLMLNTNTVISYQDNFAVAESRNVELVTGEAFFDITHNPEKPFVISSGDIKVEVLGTSFNLNFDSTARKLEIAVSSGTVRVSSGGCADSLILHRGEVASFSETGCTGSIEKPLFQNQHAWRTHKLAFVDAPMETVVGELNAVYDAEFILADSMRNCRLNAKIDQLSLTDVISILEMTFDAEIEQKDSLVFYISGSKCD